MPSVRDFDGNYVRVPLADDVTGDADIEAAVAEVLAGLDLTPTIIENFVTQDFVTQVVNLITQVTENNTFITEITENQTFITNLTELLTQLTQIEVSNTYVTNIVQQINANINGKKGIANELATLDSTSHLTYAQIPTNLLKASVVYVIDGAGNAIEAGFKGFLSVPFAGQITGVTLLGEGGPGSIVVDIWKDTYANYPPVDGDSITAAAQPAISSSSKSRDTTLTGWTKEIAAGDILGFNVDSADTLTRVTVVLDITKS